MSENFDHSESISFAVGEHVSAEFVLYNVGKRSKGEKMFPQDLEDLLKVKTFWYSDTQAIQDLVNLCATGLANEDGDVVITRIFANNTFWIGKTVTVPGDPRKGEETKEIVIGHGEKMSVYQLKIEYFKISEVENF